MRRPITSPFPGMDPHLEGHLWPDVHHALAIEIRRQLSPVVAPRYVARVEVSVVQDPAPGAEIGVLYPDVEIVRRHDVVGEPSVREDGVASPGSPGPPPLRISLPRPMEVRIPSVEIRTARGDDLVACLEILSPVNKKEPGLRTYCVKRERLIAAGVHLVEIDLIRRGQRPYAWSPKFPAAAWYVVSTRGRARAMDVWPLQLQDRLPSAPIPLLEPDPDVVLDLGGAMTAIYEDARYDLSIDYAAPPPPPPLSKSEADWVRSLVDRRSVG